MKMEHTITAPVDGILTQLEVTVGQQVEVGAVLARVETAEPEEMTMTGECDTSFIESPERQV